MTDLDDDLARLGHAPPPTAEARDRSREQLGLTLAAADGAAASSATVASLDRRRRARRNLVRAAVAATAAAAVVALTLVLPDDSGVVGTPRASAAVLLERAANQVEATEAPRLPVRIDQVVSIDASGVPGASGGRLTQECSEYVLSENDAVIDCERLDSGFGMLYGPGVAQGISSVAFADSPEAAVAALDRTVAANVAERSTQGVSATDAEVRTEILAQTLLVPQIAPAVRAEMVRQLGSAPELRAESATTATGTSGTRFTATFPDRWILALTVDDAGFVREVTTRQPTDEAGTTRDDTISMARPVAVGELPAEVAAVKDDLLTRTAAMAGNWPPAPLPSGDTSLATACTVANKADSTDTAADPGSRQISAVHCFTPG